MSESPTLKPTQKQMLLALLAKRGWDEATFAAVARVPLDGLTQAQARGWITRLTKETKGKTRPAPGDPAIVPPVKHRKKAPPATGIPDAPAPTPATAAPPAPTPPTEQEYAQAALIIKGQLNPLETTAMQTIDQLVRQVGIAVAMRAVGLARQTMQAHSGDHRLTALEQWAICCRQLQNRSKENQQL